MFSRGVNMKKLIFVLILFSTVSLNAKTFIREYTYNASEADSKITSRAIALEQVKRLLLEELGVYVHSTLQSEEIEISGEVKELTAKQIEIISAGMWDLGFITLHKEKTLTLAAALALILVLYLFFKYTMKKSILRINEGINP